MPRTAILIPNRDLVVRDPVTLRPLSPQGDAKALNSYWLRRLADGDVHEKTDLPADTGRKSTTKPAVGKAAAVAKSQE